MPRRFLLIYRQVLATSGIPHTGRLQPRLPPVIRIKILRKSDFFCRCNLHATRFLSFQGRGCSSILATAAVGWHYSILSAPWHWLYESEIFLC